MIHLNARLIVRRVEILSAFWPKLSNIYVFWKINVRLIIKLKSYLVLLWYGKYRKCHLYILKKIFDRIDPNKTERSWRRDQTVKISLWNIEVENRKSNKIPSRAFKELKWAL